MPLGWLHYTDRGSTCIRDASGPRTLAVGVGERVTGSLVDALRDEERRQTARGGLDDYRPVAIEPIDLGSDAAQWEFGWTTPDGDRLHIVLLLVRPPSGPTYTISWLTPEPDWQVNLDYWRMVRHTFRPPR